MGGGESDLPRGQTVRAARAVNTVALNHLSDDVTRWPWWKWPLAPVNPVLATFQRLGYPREQKPGATVVKFVTRNSSGINTLFDGPACLTPHAG